MKKNEIKVGGLYKASVSGRVTTVRVDEINNTPQRTYGVGRVVKASTSYSVTNLSTGRKTVFRSAAKFRGPAVSDSQPTLPGIPDVKKETPMPIISCDCEGPKETLSGKCVKCGGKVSYTKPSTKNTSLIKAPAPIAKVPNTSLKKREGVLSKIHNRVKFAHVIVQALAGTGKTTTIVQGLRYIRGMAVSISPSPQQQAVWDLLMESKDALSIIFVAFNKSIATELQSKIGDIPGCSARTMHSLGMNIVKQTFNLTGRNSVNGWRVKNLLAELTGKDIRDLNKNNPELVAGVDKLVGLCKANLIGNELGDGKFGAVDVPYTDPDYYGQEYWNERLDYISSYYGVELNGSRTEVYDLVPRILERCKDVDKDGCIDFNDMLWLPIVLNLPIPRFDLLLIDELQDTNPCQQEIAIRAGKRIFGVGDQHQAIYGFAGAGTDSIPTMIDRLQSSANGCVAVPLTVTRRCGKVIVEQAKKLVPNFEAHESNPEGNISRGVFSRKSKEYYGSKVGDGDMVLCRVNAPLISECFHFLKIGRKAQIQGRDIGTGLIRLIDSLMKKYASNNSVEELCRVLSNWHMEEKQKENNKKNPSEQRLIAIDDKHDCLLAFTEDMNSVEEIKKEIENIFSDDKTNGVLFSSIHRAKGLEADSVWFLMPEHAPCPHPMAREEWAVAQEWNLKYVAETRAIHNLIYVS